MAKKNLKFDIGSFRERVYFFTKYTLKDEFLSTHTSYDLALKTRGKKNIKSKTTQSQTVAGQFDFYQVYSFIIRDRKGFKVEKDMILYCDDILYVVHGVTPLENNPNYIEIYCNTLNTDIVEIRDILNSMPIEADYEHIIDAS